MNFHSEAAMGSDSGIAVGEGPRVGGIVEVHDSHSEGSGWIGNKPETEDVTSGHPVLPV
jgi:hypothetical protein